MAYSPTNWADGVTPVDEAHLDKIEQGIVTADANASAAVAALPAKEDKSAKGAVNGYAPLDATQKVPLVNLPPAGADLSFDGDWVAGTYQDGDVVVKDGVSFMCVGGPTTVAPDPALWGSLSPPLPPLSEGKWLKVKGGAMMWGNPAAYGSGDITVANYDLAHPDPAAAVATFRVGNGLGGSIRTIGAAAEGSRFELQNYMGGSPVTLLHNVAGTGQKLYVETLQNVILPPGYTAAFTSLGGLWLMTGMTSMTAAAAGSPSYGTTLPASPVDGQEAILVDSLTAPNYAWRFRYAASITDANKWVFLGGIPAIRMPTGATIGAGPDDGTWRYGSPGFIAPRSGLYIASGFLSVMSNSITLLGVGVAGTFVAESAQQQAFTTGVRLSLAGMPAYANAAAGQEIQLARWCNGGGTTTVFEASISVVPLRVA